MLKTVKNGSGIGVDPPPPCFFKIPTFSRFFFGSVPQQGWKDQGSLTTGALGKVFWILQAPPHQVPASTASTNQKRKRQKKHPIMDQDTTLSLVPTQAIELNTSSPWNWIYCWAPLCRLPLPAAPLLSSRSESSLVTISLSTVGCSHSALLFNTRSALQFWMATASATWRSKGFSNVLRISKFIAFWTSSPADSGCS